jgi:hypothetical protein
MKFLHAYRIEWLLRNLIYNIGSWSLNSSLNRVMSLKYWFNFQISSRPRNKISHFPLMLSSHLENIKFLQNLEIEHQKQKQWLQQFCSTQKNRMTRNRKKLEFSSTQTVRLWGTLLQVEMTASKWTVLDLFATRLAEVLFLLWQSSSWQFDFYF